MFKFIKYLYYCWIKRHMTGICTHCGHIFEPRKAEYFNNELQCPRCDYSALDTSKMEK